MDTWLEASWRDAFQYGEGFPNVWLDIETKKVDAPVGWPFKKRWSVFMVCVAFQIDTDLQIQVYSGTETEIINYLNELLFEAGLPDWVTYHATREFDEMVLSGRFTNARAAHAQYPGPWPHLPSGVIPWRNLRGRKKNHGLTRVEDLPGKDVPERWEKNEGTDRALIAWHCYLDVVDLLLSDPCAYLNPLMEQILSGDYSDPTAQRMWLDAAADSD